MKQCPKCGSELDTGFNCPKCKAKSYKETVFEYNTNGEKIYEKNTIKLVQPEPTTAEMLYYILQNPPKGQLVAYSFCDKFGDIEYEDSATGESIKNHCFGEDWCKYKTADEAIRAAYKRAREEV